MFKKIQTVLVVLMAISSAAFSSQVRADQKQKCYMIDEAGKYVDLSSICYAKPPQTINNNNNSYVNPQPTQVIREIPYSKYEVRTYYHYGADRNFDRPYFNSYPIYRRPIYVRRPYRRYSYGRTRRYGVGYGYNVKPGYRYKKGYSHPYVAPYRDRSGRYYYNRNGMKVRFR